MSATAEQRISRWNNCPAWRSPLTTGELIFHLGKGLSIPTEGWTARTFALRGRTLMMTLHRMSRLVQRKAVPHVASSVRRMLNNQLDRVISKVESRRMIGRSQSLWMQALQEVLDEPGFDLALEIVPPLQSVMSQAYAKTSAVLAQEPTPETNSRIAQESREIARRVTRIDETTRRQIVDVVQHSTDSGANVVETAAALRDKIPQLNHARSMTIARTELSNVWAEGTAKAYLESDTISHVSVIGCDAREPNSPQYRGESTCNIEQVPITELTALLAVGFHPNHQGTIVASGFRGG